MYNVVDDNCPEYVKKAVFDCWYDIINLMNQIPDYSASINDMRNVLAKVNWKIMESESVVVGWVMGDLDTSSALGE